MNKFKKIDFLIAIIPLLVSFALPGILSAETDGFSRSVTGVEINRKWKIKTNGPVVTSPAVKRGVVIFGTKNSKKGMIKAVDSSSGKTIWEYDTGDEVWSSPAISGDLVYIGGKNGWFYCFELKTGKLIWKKKLGSVFSSPLVHNDKVIVCTDRVYALDKNSGEVIWEFDFPGSTNSSPIVWNGRVYFGGGLDYTAVYSLDLATGEEIWRKRTKYSIDAPLTVAENTVLFGDWSRTFYAFDANTGQLKWEMTQGDNKKPAVVAGAAAVYDTLVFWGNGNGDFMAVDIQTGREIWSHKTQAEWMSSPLIAEDMLITLESSNPARLLFMQPGSGKLINQISFPGQRVAFLATPAIKDNIIYVGLSENGGNKGSLQALKFKKYNLEIKQNKFTAQNGATDNLKNSKKIFSHFANRRSIQPFKPEVADSAPTEFGVVGEVLYLREMWVYGDWSGRIYAYNYSGKLLWEKDIVRPQAGTPIATDDQIIVAGRTGTVTAFHRRTGLRLWEEDLGSEISTGPAKSKHGFAVGSKTGSIFFLNNDGSRGPVRKINSTVNSLSARPPFIVAGGSDGQVLVLKGALGKPYWEFQAKYGVATAFEITDDNLYFSDWLGTIYCLDLMERKKKWTFNMDRAPGRSPLLARGLLHAYSKNGKLYAIRPNNGEKIWSYKFHSELVRPLLFNEGTFYALDESGNFTRISYGPLTGEGQHSAADLQKTGYLKDQLPDKISELNWSWKPKQKSKFMFPPKIKNNWIYLSGKKRIIALRDYLRPNQQSNFSGNLKRTGEFFHLNHGGSQRLKWVFELNEEIVSSPVIVDNLLVVATTTELAAINRLDGTPAWELENQPEFTSLESYGGKIYAGNKEGEIIVLKAANGKIIRAIKCLFPPAKISISDRYLVVMNKKMQPAIFERKSGKARWYFSDSLEFKDRTEKPAQICPPVLSNGKVFFQIKTGKRHGSQQLHLAVASAETGQILQKITVREGRFFRPLKAIMVKDNNCYLVTDNSKLIKIDLKTGEVVWRKALPTDIVAISAAVMDENKILITGNSRSKLQNLILLLRANDGELIQKFFLFDREPPFLLPPVISGGKIYLQNWHGAFYSLQ